MTEKIVKKLQELSDGIFKGNEWAEDLFWFFVLSLFLVGVILFSKLFFAMLNILVLTIVIVAFIRLLMLLARGATRLTSKIMAMAQEEENNNTTDANNTFSAEFSVVKNQIKIKAYYEDGKPKAGLNYNLYDSKDNLIESLKTNKNGRAKTKELKNGKYHLTGDGIGTVSFDIKN